MASLTDTHPRVIQYRNLIDDAQIAGQEMMPDQPLSTLSRSMAATGFPPTCIKRITHHVFQGHNLWRIHLTRLPGYLHQQTMVSHLYRWCHATSPAGLLGFLTLGIVLASYSTRLSSPEPLLAKTLRILSSLETSSQCTRPLIKAAHGPNNAPSSSAFSPTDVETAGGVYTTNIVTPHHCGMWRPHLQTHRTHPPSPRPPRPINQEVPTTSSPPLPCLHCWSKATYSVDIVDS